MIIALAVFMALTFFILATAPYFFMPKEMNLYFLTKIKSQEEIESMEDALIEEYISKEKDYTLEKTSEDQWQEERKQILQRYKVLMESYPSSPYSHLKASEKCSTHF